MMATQLEPLLFSTVADLQPKSLGVLTAPLPTRHPS